MTEQDEGTPSPSPTETTETTAPADAPDAPDAHQDGGRDTTSGEVDLAHGTDKVEAGVHGSST